MRLKTGFPDEGNVQEAGLERALKNFRSSVHAWSEAEYSRPHQPVRTVRFMTWRVAAGCALGFVLAAGSLSGGLYEHHHRQELAKMAAAAAEAAREQKLEAAEQALQENEDLLAKVDSDVSRQVPRAMEPLAQLMADDDER